MKIILNKKIGVLIFFCLTLGILLGCEPNLEFSYKDIVKVNGNYYERTEEISKSISGNKIGEVKYRTPKTDGKYEYQDFEASKLDEGTELYFAKEESYIYVKYTTSKGEVFIKYVLIPSEDIFLNE
ncbi:hypothetical protein M2475_000697 [Breznakia sp. PF5-3]|uniref:hypothetical protein n=1 Tax=unclassified Breznakia TaxID=2623764 RepID=UPI0024055501|nr:MULTISPECIES: hypothetical protein [unclassified Breznakia]MDF9824407.1 hypothetical protein [Breznakia sp. PM6-1]MDF9835136.1 hypothetical protein [Breznakia sp. PF5-3]